MFGDTDDWTEITKYDGGVKARPLLCHVSASAVGHVTILLRHVVKW